MIKEAIQYILENTRAEVRNVEGHNYTITKDGYKEIVPTVEQPETLTVGSLEGLVNLILREGIDAERVLFVNVVSPEMVTVYGRFDGDALCNRTTYYRAIAQDIPGWDSEAMLGFDEMQVALFTRFQDSTDMVYVRNLLSSITTGGQVTYNDNGVATTVMTKKGVSLQEQTRVTPVVKMRPYRTFQEVEQPESPFLIRISEHGLRLIESDGGMWKLEARKNIKAYLEAALSDEIANGDVEVSL